MKGESTKCAVCPNVFVKKMKSHLYCSRDCYKKAWPINNRLAAAERSRSRRVAQPEWYQSKEPGYYKTYRDKQLRTRPWRYVFQSRRLDAKKRGLMFTITDAWCASRWTGKCELTGIDFRPNPAGKGPFPFSCSLDKIKPELGYVPENCRFILWGCNGLKGSGADEDMYAIARALISKPDRTGL